MSINIKYYFFIVGIILLSLFIYWELPLTFFQQDEWQFFGAAISALATSNPVLNTILPFGGQLTHFYPLSKLLFLLQYMLFKVSFPPYALIAIALHSINVVLVFILINKITTIKLISFATASLFLVNSFSHQATSWVLAADFTLSSTLFLLLSIIFFIDFLYKRQQSYLIISLIFLFISLFFKEVSLFLFLLYPIYLYLFDKYYHRVDWQLFKKPLLLITGFGFFYILIRVFFLFSPIRSPQPEIGDVTVATPIVYFYRFLTIPLKGFAQSFFPQRFFIDISDRLLHLGYPQFVDWGVSNPNISQSIGFDLISYMFTIIIFLISFLLFRYLNKIKIVEFSRLIPIALIFLLTNFLTFIFIPGRAGYFSIFEPRNLYVASISSSFLVVILLYTIVSVLTKGIKTKVVFFVLLLLPILIAHTQAIRADLRELKLIGQMRKSFLTTIEKDHPSLPERVIIYTQSDRSYYGMPESEKILPVQSGFGRMMMVWYQQKQQFPVCLYEDQFLQDLLAEGYKECESVGFGYFRDYNKLIREIKKSNFPIEDIIAYQWDGGIDQLTSITQKTKDLIKEELKQ